MRVIRNVIVQILVGNVDVERFSGRIIRIVKVIKDFCRNHVLRGLIRRPERGCEDNVVIIP